MEDENCMEETPCDLTKPRIVPCRNTWKPQQNTVTWCNLKLVQEKGLLFYQTRSHAIVFYDTLPAVCIEKVVCMKTKDELYQKVSLTPRIPRVVLKSSSQVCLQGQREQDARTSYDQPGGSKIPWETGSNTVDYRIPGVPLSAVEQQYTHRKDKVGKLIEKFENRLNKESFLQDFKQTKEINEVSKKSKDLIGEMNNTEIFVLCETSSKKQCTDCNSYWKIGIIYCTCGRCLTISRSEKEVDKSNNDVVSIPGYVIKTNDKRGARHGPSERQRMYYWAKETMHEARQEKHGEHSSILARWLSDNKYRKSLSDIGWTEQDIMLFDTVALENHSHVATKAERIRNIENIGF